MLYVTERHEDVSLPFGYDGCYFGQGDFLLITGAHVLQLRCACSDFRITYN